TPRTRRSTLFPYTTLFRSIRYKSLQGYDAPYVPGWDTHGLPIEHAIVTKKGIDRKKVDPVQFREMCKEYALSFVERQKEQFKRLDRKSTRLNSSHVKISYA